MRAGRASQVCVRRISVILHLRAHTGTTTGLVQSLWQLQHLQVLSAVSDGDPPLVATESEAWRIQPLLAFLGCAQLSAGLAELTIGLAPVRLSSDDRGYAYDVNRDCFLDKVVSCRELTDALRSFPALRLLCVGLFENDACQYDKKWWGAEIATRLQAHLCAQAATDVTLWYKQSVYFSSVHR